MLNPATTSFRLSKLQETGVLIFQPRLLIFQKVSVSNPKLELSNPKRESKQPKARIGVTDTEPLPKFPSLHFSMHFRPWALAAYISIVVFLISRAVLYWEPVYTTATSIKSFLPLPLLHLPSPLPSLLPPRCRCSVHCCCHCVAITMSFRMVIFAGHLGPSFLTVIFGHPYTHFDRNFDADAVVILLTVGCWHIFWYS